MAITMRTTKTTYGSAIGHSSLAVTLTYLRGLEAAELEVSDMPCL